jgi:hypothetical protein
MRQQTDYANLEGEVFGFLAAQAERALAAGVPSVVLDPGLGFAKTAEQSVALLKALPALAALGHPVLVGASRKGFVGKLSGESVASMMPGTETAFAYIQFPAPLGVQAGVFGLRDYATEIAPARTFGFLHEVEALRQQGLAKGGSLENALLIDQNGYYNSARFADEPLRHKVLDALGDLMLCGACPVGFHLTLIKAGHTLHRELARLLMSECNRMEAHDGGMAPGY